MASEIETTILRSIQDLVKEVKQLRRENRELRKLIAPRLLEKEQELDKEVTLSTQQAMQKYDLTKDQLRYLRMQNPEIIRTIGVPGVDKRGRTMRRRIRYSEKAIEDLFKNPFQR
ncbi:MAG TPA: hypothetical protein VGE24_06195 [Emticicia sp.]